MYLSQALSKTRKICQCLTSKETCDKRILNPEKKVANSSDSTACLKRVKSRSRGKAAEH